MRTFLSDWSIDTDVDARTTLGRMTGLVRRALNDPRVIYLANRVVSGANARDYPTQIAAIRDFMDRRFRFVANPIGTQTIRPAGWSTTPDAPGLLEDIQARGYTQGACDDAAVLAATLGMANARPARFRAVAFCDHSIAGTVCDPSEPLSHVITDLWDGAQWAPLDVTKPYDLARPPEIARTLIFNVS